MGLTDFFAGETAIRARLATLERAGVARIAPTPDLEPFSGYIVQIFISEFPAQRPSTETYHTSPIQEVTIGFTVNVLYKDLRAHDGAWEIISQVRDRLIGFRVYGPQPFLRPPAYEGLWQSDGRFVAGRGDSSQWVYTMKFNASVAELLPQPFDS
jgi:hypothetical protein